VAHRRSLHLGQVSGVTTNPDVGHEHLDEHQNSIRGWLLSRTGIATAVVISVLAFLIYEGHSAHLLGLLPYLLILSCPLMHIFMHGGHHGSHHRLNQGKQAEIGKAAFEIRSPPPSMMAASLSVPSIRVNKGPPELTG
jgi:hypothetical protein